MFARELCHGKDLMKLSRVSCLKMRIGDRHAPINWASFGPKPGDGFHHNASFACGVNLAQNASSQSARGRFAILVLGWWTGDDGIAR